MKVTKVEGSAEPKAGPTARGNYADLLNTMGLREVPVAYEDKVYVFKVKTLSFREKAQIEEDSMVIERRGRNLTPQLDMTGQRIAKIKRMTKDVPEGFPKPLTDAFFTEMPGEFVDAMAKAYGIDKDEEDEGDVLGESKGVSGAPTPAPSVPAPEPPSSSSSSGAT